MSRKAKVKQEELLEEKDNNNSLFKATLNMLNKEHGYSIVQSLTEMVNSDEVGLSSGSLLLDWAINQRLGGMPYGHVLEIYGPYSSGKTTLALGFCANATANCKRVIYADQERSLQPSMAINAGINADYFSVVKYKDGRKLTGILASLMKTGEVGVVVLDSLPNFKPCIDPKKGEDDIDPTKPKMAFAASFHSEAIPYLAAVASENNVLLIILNQIRKNLGGYGGGNIPYGGEVVKHQDSVRIRLSGKAANKDDRILDSFGNLVGQYTTILVDKNKTSIPMREGRIPIFLGRGVNPYLELVILAQEVGLVDGTAGRFKWADTGESIAHGKENFSQLLFDNIELYSKLRSMVIEKMSIKYNSNIKLVNSFHTEDYEKREIIIDTDSLENIKLELD